MKKLKKQQRKKSPKKNKIQDNLPHIPKDLRKLIADDVRKFLDILGMNKYKSRIYYQADEPDTRGYGRNPGDVVTASAHVDMRYLTLDVSIYPFLVEQWNNKLFNENNIHDIIAHEVSHVATNHMYRLATSVFKDEGELIDSWEGLTTIIGRLLNKIDELQSPLTNGKKGSKIKK